MAEPPLPPLARPDALTRSELLPLGSTRINILRSRALLPFVLTGATCVGLFYALINIPGYKISIYMNILAVFIVLMMFIGLYLYSGERKNILWYGFPAVLVALQLEFTFKYYYYVTRKWLPGDTEAAAATFPGKFVSNVFGPGLSEEFLKAGALFLGLALAAWLRRSGGRGNALIRGLALEGPIDGMLVGAASGGAFILIETMVQYVPNAVRGGASPAAGAVQGLMLLIPRVLNGVVGHMAYAGIVGYFAGLAVSHPRATFRLLALGYGLAALLHGFWNSSYFLSPTFGFALSALLTGTIFFACFMKARQLEASRLGLPVDGRSILALTPHLAVGPARPARDRTADPDRRVGRAVRRGDGLRAKRRADRPDDHAPAGRISGRGRDPAERALHRLGGCSLRAGGRAPRRFHDVVRAGRRAAELRRRDPGGSRRRARDPEHRKRDLGGAGPGRVCRHHRARWNGPAARRDATRPRPRHDWRSCLLR